VDGVDERVWSSAARIQKRITTNNGMEMMVWNFFGKLNTVVAVVIKGKSKKCGSWHSAAYTSQARDRKRFTVSEVAADWHELMIPQRTMRPSIARVSEQLEWTRGVHGSGKPHGNPMGMGIAIRLMMGMEMGMGIKPMGME